MSEGHRRLVQVAPAGVVYFWATMLATAAVLAVATVLQPIASIDLARAGLLTGMALVHAEAARTVEQVRRRDDAAAHIDLNSTWTIAAALVLPLPLTAVIIVVIYTHVWFRVRRTPLFRRIFNVAMYILAAGAASAVLNLLGPTPIPELMSGPSGALLVVAATAAYTVTNLLVLFGWLALSRMIPNPHKTALGNKSDNALEVATLCFGVFVAVMLHDYPLLLPVSLPLILVLHRNVLIRQLEEDARTDAKTMLLNATAWTDSARNELIRADRRGEDAGVLVLDLDLFKRVNDTYGHLAGDEVLKQFAATLRAEVRTTDLVGRFGGEEFVVLLPDSSTAHSVGIGERIRQRVEKLTVSVQTGDERPIVEGLSVSIGVAQFPAHGQNLDELLSAADKALYAAKSSGRNQVRIPEFNSP
ncbi:GGDEF domain-containing protein [Kibdelosporangium aridum]|nr:GGDEF domain-containing protein [Kibdelosporangium aridum]